MPQITFANGRINSWELRIIANLEIFQVILGAATLGSFELIRQSERAKNLIFFPESVGNGFLKIIIIKERNSLKISNKISLKRKSQFDVGSKETLEIFFSQKNRNYFSN